MRHRRPALVLLLGAIALSGCAGSSGRVDWSSIDSVDALPSRDRELWRMSSHEYDRFRTSGLIDFDPAITDYVQEVGERLVPDELRDSVVPFEFHVVLDPEPNAFSLPNGHVFVHLGLFAYLDNENQLAHVLGHEIAHVANRDVANARGHRHGVLAAAYVLGVAASCALYEKTEESFWWVLVDASVQATLGLAARAAINGHGHDAEMRADRTALEFLRAAGYDPRESPGVLDNILDRYAPPVGTVAFFLVDPKQLRARKENLSACLLDAREKDLLSSSSAGSGRNSDVYRERTGAALRRLPELWVRAGKPRRAIHEARAILSEHPDDALVRFWMAEALRRLSDDPDAPERAMENYRTALSNDSTLAECHRGLGYLAEARGDLPRATAELRTYLELRPNARDRRYIARKIKTLNEVETP